MIDYQLKVRRIGTTDIAAVVDFNAPHDHAAMTKSARLAGVFPYDVWHGGRLIHHRRQRARLSLRESLVGSA